MMRNWKKDKEKEGKEIRFFFRLLDKKKVALCLFIEAFLDLIYYVIPYTFTLFLTMPFTVRKAVIVASIFIFSKSIRCVILWLQRWIQDNYLYDYSNKQFLEYYKKLVKVPVDTLTNYQTGYLESMIEKISELVKRILSAEYIGIFLSFTFFFYTIFHQSITLFFIAFLVSVICVIVSVLILKKSNRCVEELYDQEYEYSSVYQDFISNIRTVKALNHADYFEEIIKEQGKKCYQKQKRYVKYYSLEELIRNVLIVIPFALAIGKSVVDLSNGIDTLGIITFYISIYLEMGFIFDELSGTIVSCFELKALRKKCVELFYKLDHRPVLKDFKQIVLKDIALQYKGSKFAIKVPRLIIHQGDKISITGRSGQGKTSLMNLILGNIDQFKGQVMIDEKNLKEVRLDIGVVSQEIELFNRTIKENLCLDKPITDDKVVMYLKELELDEILMYENGIHTVVGEKGLKLSTGQKRRMNLLRSYLMDKTIYILDEPTSNLDQHTEEVVVNFILKYFRNKTLIIVTHNEKINEICHHFYYFQDHQLMEKSRENIE